eukprot:1031910-Pelagomonas_calceolata.AAC.1
MASPSAIPLMMIKLCSDSCATQHTPPSKPPSQLPPSCNAYMSWLNHYPDLAKVLAKLPTGKIQFQTPQH